MVAYYNEIDPKAAAWLRQLIKNGLIVQGEVDERSIIEVLPSDIKGFTQCHFFAGIGGWSYALRLAGWSDNKPVWTGSCPCQPFSTAGANKGKSDDRHLWPHFFRLIRECQPNTLFGEQVEGAIRHGWLDDLQTDLEGEGYAVGHCVLGAHSINAAHIRQRLYWVGHSKRDGYSADTDRQGVRKSKEEGRAQQFEGSSTCCGLGIPHGAGSQQGREVAEGARHGNSPIATSSNGGMGNPKHNGQLASKVKRSHATPILSSEKRQDSTGEFKGTGTSTPLPHESYSVEWIYCRDNKYRPIKPGIKPLVNGLPKGMVYSSDSIITPNDTQEARTMRLKGYGNAIVPQVAAEFIKAFV